MADLPKHPVLDRLKQIPVDMRAYVEKRLELVSLETGEKLANIFAKTASTVATTLIALMALLFVLLAAGFFIGDLLNSYSMGFGVIAVLLAVFALVVYLLAPEAIEDKVRERIAREFLKEIEAVVNNAQTSDDDANQDDLNTPTSDQDDNETVLVESPIAPTKSKTS